MFGASWMRSGRPGGGAWRRLSLGALYGLSRLVSSARPQRADLLVIEQELVPLLPVGVERLLLGAQAPVVIELDDAHHLVPHRRAKMEAWFGSADAVIVGNEVLAQAVRRAGGRPLVVPTCVNLDHYPSDQLAAHDGSRLRSRCGWSGSKPCRRTWLEQAVREALAADPRGFGAFDRGDGPEGRPRRSRCAGRGLE